MWICVGCRLVPAAQQAALSLLQSSAASPCHVLITGGMGGLGTLVIIWLSQQAAAMGRCHSCTPFMPQNPLELSNPSPPRMTSNKSSLRMGHFATSSYSEVDIHSSV